MIAYVWLRVFLTLLKGLSYRFGMHEAVALK